MHIKQNQIERMVKYIYIYSKMWNAADEGHPHQLSHPECLPTHVIQMTKGVNSTQSDLYPVPPVLCAPITEQT